MQVPFYRHGLNGSCAESVAHILESPFLTTGSVARGVEDKLRAFFDIPHAKLTNSWTNGAVATLLALEIGPGDEVIVPAMTFIASANVVELVGAKPVFVDVEPGTLLISTEQVNRALTGRTKAIIPVHLYGQMVDIEHLRGVVGDSVAIVEDAAHCFEGTLRGQRPGQFSDAAIFSFYATKNVTCGEGGAIITKSNELAEALQLTTLHGMSASAADRFKRGGYRHWDMERLGTKANLPDLLAALLPDQIDAVFENLERRRSLAERYRTALSGLNYMNLPEVLEECSSAHHLFAVHVSGNRRDEVMERLNQNGIGATVNYTSVTETTYYRKKYGFSKGDFPVAENWGHGTLTLPLYPNLQTFEQDYIIEVLTGQAMNERS